jgi:hypothetical protein
VDVHFRLPVPSSTLVTNLLGLLGLAAVVIAVGLLAGFAWGLLGAGVIAVGLSALAQNAARPAPVAAAAGAPPLKAVA